MAGLAMGLAQGLEAGFEMGRKVDQDRERKAQTELTNTRLAEQDARQVRSDDRQAKLDELKLAHDQFNVASAELGEYASEGNAIAQQYGSPDKIPPEIATEYAARGAPIKARRDALRQKFMPAQEYMQEGLDVAARAKAGQLDLMDPKIPAKQVVQALVATTGMLPASFKPGPKGEPSEMLQATNDFRAGLEGKNEGLALRALNKLAGPELAIGVGDPSPYGGVIEGKQIVKILPAPPGGPPGQDPNAGKVGVVLRVFVRETDPNAGAAETRQMQNLERERYGGPPGATGHYDTTVTQNRSTDPADPVSLIDMDKALERITKIETLATAFIDPQFAARVAAGEKEDGGAADVFLRAHRAAGGKLPPPKMTTDRAVANSEFGSTVLTRDEKGNVVKTEVVGATGVPKTGPLGQKLADIRSDPNLSDADKVSGQRVAVGVQAKPKAGGMGGAGGGGGGKATGGGSVALGGAAAPDPKSDKAVDFWARAVIAGDKDWRVGLGRSKSGSALIEAVKRRVPQMADELGLKPQDIGTNRAQNAALGATLKELTKRSAAVELFASKVEKDMQTLDAELTAAGSGSPLLLQKPINTLRRQFSDPALSRLDLAAKQVGLEYERLITGGALSVAQLHVGAQEDAKKLLNGDMSPKQARAVMDLMRTEMKNAKDAAHESTRSVQDQMRAIAPDAPAAKAAAPSKAPTAIKTDADFHALPSGAEFIAPDGSRRRKP